MGSEFPWQTPVNTYTHFPHEHESPFVICGVLRRFDAATGTTR